MNLQGLELYLTLDVSTAHLEYQEYFVKREYAIEIIRKDRPFMQRVFLHTITVKAGVVDSFLDLECDAIYRNVDNYYFAIFEKVGTVQ